MLPIRTILHATDFSASADYAFNLACALARDYHARLLVVHIRPLPTTMLWEGGYMPPGDEIRDEEERLRALTPPAGVLVDYLLAEGVPDAEIVRLAAEHHCDLIVLGTHGRTGLGRLLMGSVAEMVVRKAPCPVLTIRHPLPQALVESEAAAQPAGV